MASVSVIIPVYNPGEELLACLKALLAQELSPVLTGIELLLVDDCSTDSAWKEPVNALLSSSNSAVQVRMAATTVNGGPGAARNKGLELATGDYVAFVDSDDLPDPDYCRSLCEAAIRTDADMVWCDALREGPDGTKLLEQIRFDEGPLDRKSRSRILRHYVTYLWTGLFRRTFLKENGITFPQLRSAEDSCFTGCCWLTAERAAAVRRPLYHYKVQEKSLSHKRNPRRWRDRLASFSTLKAFAKEKGLWRTYWCSLRWVIFKKGWVLALRDLLVNL